MTTTKTLANLAKAQDGTVTIDARLVKALNERRKAYRAYKRARSEYMSYVVSHNDWSDDPRMAEAAQKARDAWAVYEWSDIKVTTETGRNFDEYTHKP